MDRATIEASNMKAAAVQYTDTLLADVENILQASIDYINDIKDINSLNIKEDLLMNASKEILNRTTDRLSRVSSSILDE